MTTPPPSAAFEGLSVVTKPGPPAPPKNTLFCAKKVVIEKPPIPPAFAPFISHQRLPPSPPAP